jgi:hypothetical protein
MIRRSGAGIFGWAGMILLILSAGVARGQASPPAATKPDLGAGDADSQRVLNRQISQIDFSLTPFRETFGFFGQKTKANFVVEYKEMKWLDPTTPITLSMHDVTVSKALEAELGQIGLDKLAYIVDRGVVTISTPDGLERLRQMKADEDYSFADEDDRKILDRPLPTVTFPQVPLDEAIKFLGEVSGLDIQVPWGVIAAAGVDPKQPIDCRVHDVKTSKVLDIILRDAAPDKIEWVIDQGAVKINTPAALDILLIQREYDLKGLAQGSDSIKLELRRLVTCGSQATMTDNGTILMITQTRANQRAIADFIRQLQTATGN